MKIFRTATNQHRCEPPPVAQDGDIGECDCGRFWIAVTHNPPPWHRGQWPARRGWFAGQMIGWEPLGWRRARRLIRKLSEQPS